MNTMKLEAETLEKVRALERLRIKATGANDVDALAPLLDDQLIYINSAADIYNKERYLSAIKSHALTYDKDFDVRETEYRITDGLVIFAGVMLGHSRLDGERQVFRFRSLSVWRERSGEWRMIAWQSSSSSNAAH